MRQAGCPVSAREGRWVLASDEVQPKSQHGTIARLYVARLYVDHGDRVALGTVLADDNRGEFQLPAIRPGAGRHRARAKSQVESFVQQPPCPRW